MHSFFLPTRANKTCVIMKGGISMLKYIWELRDTDGTRVAPFFIGLGVLGVVSVSVSLYTITKPLKKRKA